MLARGDPVAALVRDPDKARRAFGEPHGLHMRPTRLDDPSDLAESKFLARLISAGVPAGTAELLIAREWSILAGENDYTTDTFQQITGRPPRPVAEFLHEHRAEFV